MVLQVIDVANSAQEAFYAADCPSTNSVMSFVTESGAACNQTAAYFAGESYSYLETIVRYWQLLLADGVHNPHPGFTGFKSKMIFVYYIDSIENELPTSAVPVILNNPVVHDFV